MLHVLYVTYMLYVTYSPKSITYVVDNICDSISYNMKIPKQNQAKLLSNKILLLELGKDSKGVNK